MDTLGRLARPRGNRSGRLVASRGDLGPDGYGEEMVQTMNPKGAANSVVEWGRRFESFLRHRRFTEIEDHGNLESERAIMRRRAFLGFCIAISLFFPRLSRGIGVLGDKDELIIVNG